MRPITPERIDNKQVKLLVVVLFCAAIVGTIFVALFLRFPATYATFVCAAMIMPLAAFIVGDSKKLLLAMLATLLPITVDITINHTGYVGGPAGYVVSLYDAVLLALYLIWFGEMTFGKNRFQIRIFPAISIPAILLVLVTCLSALHAERQDLSLYAIIELCKMVLTFFYLANNIRRKDEVRFLIRILVFGLLFEGILGFAQHRYSEPFFPSALGGPHWIDSRISGTWISYNDFAWYLTFILPISISMFFYEKSLFYKMCCGASFVFGSAALMWTNSRGGWISFTAGLCFSGIFLFLKTENRRILVGRFFTIILVCFLAVPIYPRLYYKMHGRFTGSDRGSAESRLPQFEMAYDMIMDNPLLGVGINNYVIVMNQYDDTDEGIDSITHNAVHNIFLHLGAEIGLPGLIFFFWFILAIFLSGMRVITSNSGFETYAVIGMLGGILAFLVHGLADVQSLGEKLYLFVWFFAGTICAISGIKEEKGSSVKNLDFVRPIDYSE